MVFVITGLQARTLILRIGDYSMSELALSAVVVSAVVILARFVWIYPATYLPRWLIPWLRRRDPSPPWQWPFVLAFTGVRGIVSLAAALALPFATINGQLFPNRDLILFLTFSVILVTLVGQGLMLPWVIRTLGLALAGRRERHVDRDEEHKARRQAIEAAIERLDQLRMERHLSENAVRSLRAHQRDRLKHIEHRNDGDDGHGKLTQLHDEIELQLIAAERQQINDLFRSGKLKDEARRRIERELDLREAQLVNQQAEE
jgi:monovalent cation/hydrogen antiporter